MEIKRLAFRGRVHRSGDALARLIERVGDRGAERQGAEGQGRAKYGKDKRIFRRGGARLILPEMPIPAHRTIPLSQCWIRAAISWRAESPAASGLNECQEFELMGLK